MLNAFHNEALGKLVLRLALGIMILLHGINKLVNPGSLTWISDTLASHGLPTMLAYGALLGEVVAPLMVILGWNARLGGLLIAGNMLVAIYLAHMSQLFTLTSGGGWALELQGMFLFAGIALMLLGSGRMAIKPD